MPTSSQIESKIWEQMQINARAAGLDASKFNEAHQQVVREVVQFLTTEPKPLPLPSSTPTNSLRRRIGRRMGWVNEDWQDTAVTHPAIPPIIICGKPGTGKTTFLYLLDNVLRELLELPDNIQPVMEKGTQRLAVHKRAHSGQQVSLLSVRKWTQLLHFYAWDVLTHTRDAAALARFVQDILLPMRVVFADEVEMTGYSPTIPELANLGILVVGTSNQYEFEQLDQRQLAPRIHRFEGVDMRLGNPADAIVLPNEPLWALFAEVLTEPLAREGQLAYRVRKRGEGFYLWLDLQTAVSAPMLETDWIQFLQTCFAQTMQSPFTAQSSFTLLLDNFSLDILKKDFNAVIRFVNLFDAIEQLGLAVLVRNQSQPPQLSREAMTFLKTTIYNAIGVPDDVKRKTAVGLDRCTSRIGQAGYKAHQHSPYAK